MAGSAVMAHGGERKKKSNARTMAGTAWKPISTEGNQPIHTSVRNLKGVFTGWHSQDSPFWEHELFIDLTRS